MGRFMDKLKISCRQCNHEHIPRRLSARYHDGLRKRVHLWECKECGHIWIDSAFKKKSLKTIDSSFIMGVCLVKMGILFRSSCAVAEGNAPL